MKKYFFRIIRDLLESYRIKREYLRPVGPLMVRNITPQNIVISKVTDEDINALEVFLSSGDYTKHESRLQAQKEGLADYLIVHCVALPIGHLLIMWNGGDDGPLSGREDKEVRELIGRFKWMREMMGGIGQQAGLLAKIPGMKQMATARKLKEQIRIKGAGAMEGIAAEMLESAVADMAGAGGGTRRVKKKVNKAQRKKSRKNQKKSRKKARKR